MSGALKVFYVGAILGGATGLASFFKATKSSNRTNLTERSAMTMNLYSKGKVWVCLVNKDDLLDGGTNIKETSHYELLFWYVKKSGDNSEKKNDCQSSKGYSNRPEWYWRVTVSEKDMEELIKQTITENEKEYFHLGFNLESAKNKLKTGESLEEDEEVALSTLITKLKIGENKNWTWARGK